LGGLKRHRFGRFVGLEWACHIRVARVGLAIFFSGHSKAYSRNKLALGLWALEWALVGFWALEWAWLDGLWALEWAWTACGC